MSEVNLDEFDNMSIDELKHLIAKLTVKLHKLEVAEDKKSPYNVWLGKFVKINTDSHLAYGKVTKIFRDGIFINNALHIRQTGELKSFSISSCYYDINCQKEDKISEISEGTFNEELDSYLKEYLTKMWGILNEAKVEDR